VTDKDKDFTAGMDSDARKTPVRVAFVTRRTSAAVRVQDEAREMTHPYAFLRILVAIQVLAFALVVIALRWDAPLEGLADPLHTPNPAKAPWYFLGLQELLHYFPPVVAGVLIPTLVVLALIVIPYFNVNVQAEGLFLKDRRRRVQIFAAVAIVLSVFLAYFDVYVALAPTLIVIAFAAMAAAWSAQPPGKGFRAWLVSKPLSFWIMTWFLFVLIVLTAVGTFFRGPGWSWIWPWEAQP
jgi:hypothetical protein